MNLKLLSLTEMSETSPKLDVVLSAFVRATVNELQNWASLTLANSGILAHCNFSSGSATWMSLLWTQHDSIVERRRPLDNLGFEKNVTRKGKGREVESHRQIHTQHSPILTLFVLPRIWLSFIFMVGLKF